MIGHEQLGTGPSTVILLNDWLCDTSTWDGARPYLDRARFTWTFADLRGYGRSMGQGGSFTVTEAAADVIALADSLACERVSIIGHSMSSLIALHLAQTQPARIERVIALTPPPPTGFGADDETLAKIRAMGAGDDTTRTLGMKARGTRLSDQWTAFKVARWRACADPKAVEAYASMFARDGMPNPTGPITLPVLAITGEEDAPMMRRDAVEKFLSPLCEQLEVRAIIDSGHYPMQETPPLLVTIVERFLLPIAT